MSRAVYLCGFMGCGKTTVGRVLADLLGTAYADMDAYIEKSEKMSIPQIFSDKGEGYFRDAETRAVEEMGKNGGVIACGGGAMLREKNADLAAKNGVVVYIDTPYDICWERIKDDAIIRHDIFFQKFIHYSTGKNRAVCPAFKYHSKFHFYLSPFIFLL